jgi:hypothetical protein
MLLLPLIPAIVSFDKPKEPTLSFLGILSFYRGTILVSGGRPVWHTELRMPALSDRLANIQILQDKPGGEYRKSLGLNNPGVYFLSKSGRVLAQFQPEEAPPRLEETLDAIGWFSLYDVTFQFIRHNPDRIDARWKLLRLGLEGLQRSMDEAHLQRCAEALDELSKQPGWAQAPNVYRAPIEMPEKLGPDNPITVVAERRWSSVTEILKQSPDASAAWEVASFLAEWHPAKPRLYKIIADLSPLPEESTDFTSWPLAAAITQCIEQLRKTKDWAGLREFSEDRLRLVDGYIATFNPEAGREWSGTTIHTDGKTVHVTNRDKWASALGFWLINLLEAELNEDRSAPAAVVATRILQEGRPRDRQRAMGLAKRFKSETLVRLLESQP